MRSNGTPLELVTTFEYDDIQDFKYHQNGNILYIVTRNGIYALVRNSSAGDNAFSFDNKTVGYTVEPLTFVNTKEIALKPSGNGAAGAAITLTPQKPKQHPTDPDVYPNLEYAPLFFPSDVSSENEIKDLVLSYMNMSTGEIIGRYWIRVSSVNTIPGTTFKSITGIIDLELSSGDRLPNTDPVMKWQISAFSSDRGFPSAATIYEGRQFLANNKSYPLGIWGSSVLYQDWFNYFTGSNPGDAVQNITSMEKSDEILWLVGQSKLFIGTRGGIYIGGAASYNDEAITPASFRVRLFQSVGANPLQPITAMDTVFFIDSSGRNVHEIAMGENGVYQAYDLSLLANDLTQSGIIAHTWQQAPIKTYWCAVNDGYLCSLTYLKNNDVLAWAKHIIAGKNVKVTSLATIHEDRNDYVWMLVQREINGKIVRYIEYLYPMYDPLGQEEFKQFYVDSGIIKEKKYTIDKIINSADNTTSKSKNAYISCNMTYFRGQGYKNEYLICFKVADNQSDAVLGTRKIFLAKNVTDHGFDIFHDTRDKNISIPYKKINPLDYPGYNFRATNTQLFFKISNIIGFESQNTETFIKCDIAGLANGNLILIQNSNIRYSNIISTHTIDFPDEGKVFKVQLDPVRRDGFYLRTLDDQPVITNSSSILYKNAELYITYHLPMILGCNVGTNCVIQLKTPLPGEIFFTPPGSLTDIVYANGMFFSTSNKGVVYRSADGGVSWTPSITKNMGKLSSISFGNNTFVVGVNHSNNTSGYVSWYSNDGINWTGVRQSVDMPGIDRLAFGNGIFVALGTAPSYIYYSTDNGHSWQAANFGHPSYGHITFGAGKFVVVNQYYGYIIYYSIDGNNWTSVNINFDHFYGIAYGAGKFVILGMAGTVHYSADAITWNRVSTDMPHMLNISFANNKFIATGNKKIYYSENATSWTASKSSYEQTIPKIASGNEVLVAISYHILRSLDNSITWKRMENINRVYINKVYGTTEINRKRYSIAWASSDRKSIVLYDLQKSPSINDYAVIDSSSWSEYDVTMNNNGNLYLYFTAVDGLDHLIGQEVSICGDGNKHADMIVAEDGSIVLKNPVMYCSVGLKIKSILKTVPFSGGSLIGTSDGTVGSQKDSAIYLYHSLGGRYGAEADYTFAIPYKYHKNTTSDHPQNLYTGRTKVPLPNSKNIYNRTIYLEHDDPLSFNILSIAHDINVSDA
jgi:hypothetical protein